jgi:hypothetical protein
MPRGSPVSRASSARWTRGPEGWRHRLALIGVDGLSCFASNRIRLKRLEPCIVLCQTFKATALAHVRWAVQRLTGAPGPQ